MYKLALGAAAFVSTRGFSLSHSRIATQGAGKRGAGIGALHGRVHVVRGARAIILQALPLRTATVHRPISPSQITLCGKAQHRGLPHSVLTLSRQHCAHRIKVINAPGRRFQPDHSCARAVLGVD